MFDDLIENKQISQKDIDFDEELVRIEEAVRAVSKSFYELLDLLPQTKEGLSGVSGYWPTGNSISERIDKVVLRSYVTKVYIEQIIKRIQGELCQTN